MVKSVILERVYTMPADYDHEHRLNRHENMIYPIPDIPYLIHVLSPPTAINPTEKHRL